MMAVLDLLSSHALLSCTGFLGVHLISLLMGHGVLLDWCRSVNSEWKEGDQLFSAQAP